MPFVVIIVGILIFVTALHGNIKQFGALLASEFQGQNSFVYWFIAILVIGAVGYIKPLKGLANSFLILLILVLFLANKGFFQRFSDALKSIAAGSSGLTGSST